MLRPAGLHGSFSLDLNDFSRHRGNGGWEFRSGSLLESVIGGLHLQYLLLMLLLLIEILPGPIHTTLP